MHTLFRVITKAFKLSGVDNNEQWKRGRESKTPAVGMQLTGSEGYP